MIIRRWARALLVLSLVVAAAGAVWAEKPRRDFPRVGKYEVLCGDFHEHTTYSDGQLSVRQRVEEAVGLGYDVIAITDHGKASGCRTAEQAGRELGVIVVSGFETGTSGDGEHLVVLGVPPSYQACGLKDANTLFYRDEMKKIAAAGGIIFYAHPNFGIREDTNTAGSVGGKGRLATRLLPEATTWGIEQGYIVGIEVQNGWGDRNGGWGVQQHGDVWCYPHGFDWALQHNLTLFADTDIHPRNAKPNQPVTLVFTTSRTADGVLEAIRARNTVAWFNDMVWGREKLLSELLNAVVSVKQTADKRVVFENQCPITLKCALAASPDKTVELGPYASITTDWPAEKSVRVTWTNLWTSPKTNLETTVTPAR